MSQEMKSENIEKKNTKVLVSLVVASIAAMASVPDLLKDNSESKKLVNLKNSNKNEDQLKIAENVKEQMNTVMNKKTPILKMGESVDILVSNYGDNDKNIKEKIYNELNLGVTYTPYTNNQDSTNIGPGGGMTGTQATNSSATKTGAMSCHSACHGNCHSACHGSRGWRNK